MAFSFCVVTPLPFYMVCRTLVPNTRLYCFLLGWFFDWQQKANSDWLTVWWMPVLLFYGCLITKRSPLYAIFVKLTHELCFPLSKCHQNYERDLGNFLLAHRSKVNNRATSLYKTKHKELQLEGYLDKLHECTHKKIDHLKHSSKFWISTVGTEQSNDENTSTFINMTSNWRVKFQQHLVGGFSY